MWRVSLRSAAASWRRLVLTATAVVLGVSFATGALVLSATAGRHIDGQFAETAPAADLIVRTATAFDAAMGVEVERDPVPAGLVDRIKAAPGVQDAAEVVRVRAELLHADGTPVLPDAGAVAAGWVPPPFSSLIVREGRAPAAAGEVLLDVLTARTAGVRPGASLLVRGPGGEAAVTVVGLAALGERDGVPGTSAAVLAVDEARRLAKVGTGATEIGVVLRQGATLEESREGLRSVLGESYEVATTRALAAASAQAAKTPLAVLQAMLGVIAVAALVVGAFLIANTFNMVALQRLRELAVLRALGASPRQVAAVLLGEAAVVGLLASAAGVPLGIAAAALLRTLSARFGVALPDGGLVVPASAVVAGLVVGTAVTLVAAVSAARRAARVAPIAALREADATPAGGRVARAATRFLLAVGAPVARRGVAGRLAVRAAAGAPRRTAATSAALAVGLALVVLVTVLGASVRTSTLQGMTEVLRADAFVESARGEMLGGLHPDVHHLVAAVPEVGAVSRIRLGHWKHRGSTEALTAVEPETLPAVADLDLVAGSLDALRDGGVVISETIAEAEGLGVGDTLAMTVPRGGDQQVPVVGILEKEDQWAMRTGYLVSVETAMRFFTEDVDATLLVRFADGVEQERGMAALREAIAVHANARAMDEAEARRARTATLDQALGLVRVLLAFTLLIALLGIANTLALAVVERRRELALLRAVGMSRSQLRSAVRLEAALLAVIGALSGTALGVAGARLALAAFAGQLRAPMVLPAGQLLVAVGAMVVAAILAAAGPARRAAKLDILAAVAR